MLIRYRQPRLILSYPRLVWTRLAAWRDADRRGGYRRAHTADAWQWLYEPELKQRNYLKALARRVTRFGSMRYQELLQRPDLPPGWLLLTVRQESTDGPPDSHR